MNILTSPVLETHGDCNPLWVRYTVGEGGHCWTSSPDPTVSHVLARGYCVVIDVKIWISSHILFPIHLFRYIKHKTKLLTNLCHGMIVNVGDLKCRCKLRRLHICMCVLVSTVNGPHKRNKISIERLSMRISRQNGPQRHDPTKWIWTQMITDMWVSSEAMI